MTDFSRSRFIEQDIYLCFFVLESFALNSLLYSFEIISCQAWNRDICPVPPVAMLKVSVGIVLEC